MAVVFEIILDNCRILVAYRNLSLRDFPILVWGPGVGSVANLEGGNLGVLVVDIEGAERPKSDAGVPHDRENDV